jgi:hypothetical protein
MDKRKIENTLHKIILSVLFVFINWLIINNLIVDVSILRYVFIEGIILVSMKCYILLISKLKL